MKNAAILLTFIAALPTCRSEALMGDPDRVWTLKEFNGAPFSATATLRFPKPEQIAGQAPCNRYFGAQKAEYPAFDAGPIGSTKMACPTLETEIVFLEALQSATTSLIAGDTLTLSNTAGLKMVFKATD